MFRRVALGLLLWGVTAASGCNSKGVAVGADATNAAVSVSSASVADSAAQPPPSAIDPTLPSLGSFGVADKASCAKTCRLSQCVPDALRPPADSLVPAVMWEEDLEASANLSVPRSSDVDLLGMTLSGSIALAPAEGRQGRAASDAGPLTMWHAFIAPGAGVTLSAVKGSARVLLIAVTSGEPIAPHLDPTDAHAWKQRRAPIAQVDLASLPDLAWAKGAYHARIGFAAEQSPRASLGVLRMSAEGTVAAHRHDKEWELMGILEGDGDFV
ncbi:MAG TPA: hypothetical protein VF881_15155, partial [Polyangiaceae bacterium]